MTRRTALGGLVGLYASVAHAATRLPDLVVSAMSAPSTVAAGDTITVTYTVRNVGNLKAGPSTLACLLSGPPGLQSLGTAPVKALTRGSRTSGSLSVTIPAANPSGSYTLQLVADVGRVVTESNESNNTATRGLTITNEEEPMTLPTLPQVWVDTTMPAPALVGSTTHVCTSTAAFTQALLDADLGDIIELQAGTVFQGPFTLPNKTPAAHSGNPDNSEWIIIRSSAYASLPAEGTRVAIADASNMPKVQADTSNSSALYTDTSAHHYRFVGIELRPPTSTFVNTIVTIGAGETTVAAQPHHVVWDRCYIHGDATAGSRRGIAMNGVHLAVIDSYISDFKEVGGDSQGLASWGGAGPFKIVNNYIEAAAENILFGGAYPTVPLLIGADIEIRQNLFSKPLSWRSSHPSYEGTPWTVKNSFELKSARRVLIDGNIFEHTWQHAQDGYALLFTPAGDSGAWAAITDVTVTNNLIRHTSAGYAVRGYDGGIPGNPEYPGTSERTHRVVFRNNLLWDIGGTTGGPGFLFFPNSDCHEITIEHNTGFQGDARMFLWDGLPSVDVILINNIAFHGNAGATGIDTYAPGALFTKNVLIGPYPSSAGYSPSWYTTTEPHPGNFFPEGTGDVGFVDYAGGNYALTTGSPYHNAATDGTDVGVDIAALNLALSGVWTPPAVDVDFSATPLSGVTPLSIAFTDTSTGTITSWQWIFGDGATSTAQHPSHTYTTAGTYTISLNVTGPGGSFSHTKTAYITATAGVPVAAFSGTPLTGMSPLNVVFTDASTGSITSRAWDFGDGGTSPDASPSHTYILGGTHTVSLTVTGPGGSDAETKPAYVTVSIPKHVLVRLS